MKRWCNKAIVMQIALLYGIKWKSQAVFPTLNFKWKRLFDRSTENYEQYFIKLVDSSHTLGNYTKIYHIFNRLPTRYIACCLRFTFPIASVCFTFVSTFSWCSAIYDVSMRRCLLSNTLTLRILIWFIFALANYWFDFRNECAMIRTRIKLARNATKAADLPNGYLRCFETCFCIICT